MQEPCTHPFSDPRRDSPASCPPAAPLEPDSWGEILAHNLLITALCHFPCLRLLICKIWTTASSSQVINEFIHVLRLQQWLAHQNTQQVSATTTATTSTSTAKNPTKAGIQVPDRQMNPVKKDTQLTANGNRNTPFPFPFTTQTNSVL